MTTLLSIPANGSTTTSVPAQNYTHYTYTYTATSTATSLSFEFREDPAYWSLDNISFAPVSGNNMLLNSGFELGTLADWTVIGTPNLQAAGTIAHGTPTTTYDGPYAGQYYYRDGAVGGVDGIDQDVQTVIGQSYTISFWLGNDQAGTGELAIVSATGLSAPTNITLNHDGYTTGPNQTANTSPTISGTADVGQVVQVYNNGTAVGTATSDSTGAWSYTFTTPLSVGSHSITATEGNNGTQTASSAPLNLTVQQWTAATPGLTAATDTGVVGDGVTSNPTPVLTGTGVSGDTIHVSINGQAVGTATVGSNNAWTYTVGQAYDNTTVSVTTTEINPSGNASAASAPFSLTIDTTTPATPAIPGLTPASDSGIVGDGLTNDASPTLTGTGAAGDTVTVYDGSTVLGTTSVNQQGSWNFQASSLSNGAHQIHATQTNVAGTTSATSGNFALHIDTSVPSAPTGLALSQSTDTGVVGDGVTSDNTPTLTGTGTAGDTVTIMNGTTVLGSTTVASNGTWSATPTSPVADGTYYVTATQTNAAGTTSSGSQPYTVTIDTSTPAPPSVVSLSPATDSGTLGDGLTNDNTPTFVGTGVAGDTVTLLDGTQTIGSALVDSNSNWSITAGSPLADGSYTVTSVETNVAGTQSAASQPATITIDTSVPNAPVLDGITASSDSGTLGDGLTNDNTPTWTGTGSAGDTVTVLNGTTVLGTGVVGQNGTWSVTATTPLVDGSYNVTTTQTNAAGTVSTASAASPLQIDTSVPMAPGGLALTPASDTGTVGDHITSDNTPTLTGTGMAGDTVTIFDGTTALGTAVVGANGTWAATPTGPVADGTYAITATETNAAGTSSGVSQPYSVTIDTSVPAAPSAPVLAAGSDSGTPGDGITNDNDPVITGTGIAGDTVTLTDGAAAIGQTVVDANGNWSITPASALADGQHNLAATQTNAAGTASPVSANTTITIDTSTPAPPSAAGLAPASDSGVLGDGITNNNTPTFTGTGVAGDTVTLTDGTTTIGTALVGAGGVWSITTPTALADGQHTLVVTQTNAAGTVSAASGAATITIDTSVPVAPSQAALAPSSDSGVLGDGITSDNLPTFTGTGVAGDTVTLTDGSTTIGTAVVGTNGGWSVTAATALTDGQHTLETTETNAAGTVSSMSGPTTITIDTATPTAPAGITLAPGSDSGVLGDGITNNNTPTFTGTGVPGDTVALTNGTATIGTAVVGANGTWSITPTTALTDGQYSLTATQTNAAGTVSTASTAASFTIDTSIPAAPSSVTLAPTSDSGVVGDGITNDNTPTLTGTGVAGDTVTVTDGSTTIGTAVVGSNGTWSVTPATALTDGQHTLETIETNAAGTVSPVSAPTTITIDTTTPPTPSTVSLVPSSDSGVVGDGITNDNTPTLTGTGAAGDTVTVTDGASIVGTAVVGSNGVWSVTASTALADGQHTFVATQTNAAGTVSAASGLVTITIDTSIPAAPSSVSLSPGSDSGTLGDNITNDNTPTLTGTGVAGDTVTVTDGTTVIGTTVVGSNGTWAFASAQALADGQHSFVTTQTNAAGTVSSTSAATTITIDTTSPVAPAALGLAPSSDSGVLGDGLTNDNLPTVTGTGTAGDTVTLTDGTTLIGTAVVGSNGTWSVTPTTALADGQHSLTATQTNAAGTTSGAAQSFLVTIDTTVPAQPSAVQLAPGSDSGQIGDGITNDTRPTLTGTGVVGDTVTLVDGASTIGSAVVGPNGIWSVTSNLPLAEGQHDLIATETNAAGTTSPVGPGLSLQILTQNPTVSLELADDTGVSGTDGITSNDTLAVNTSQAGTITVTIDGQTVQSFAATSGAQTILPPTLADGQHQVTVTDTDVAGNIGSSTIDFTLDRTPPVVSIGLANDTGVSATDHVTSDATLIGRADANSTVSIFNGQTLLGTTTASSTGDWTYAPTGLADGAYTLTATQTDEAGNTTTSALSLVLDTHASALTARLADDTGISNTDGITNTATLTGTAQAGSSVSVFDGQTLLGSSVVAANGTWTVAPSSLQDGTYTLTVADTDQAGNVATTSVGVTLDRAIPEINVALAADTGVSSSDGLTSNPAIVTTASVPGDVVTTINGQVVQTVQTNGGAQTFTPSNLADGTYHVVVSETDTAGNVGTASLTYTLDTTAPVVTVGLLHDSGTIPNNGITNNAALGGTADPGSTVTVSNGATVLGTTTVGQDGVWSYTPTNLVNGQYALTASETDGAGNTGTATVTFTLDTSVPTVTAVLADDTGISAHDGITDNPALTGTALAGSVVTISEGTTVLGTASANAQGVWQFLPTLTNGAHTLTISQTNAAGNTGTAQVGLDLIATRPTVTVGLANDTGASNTDGITSVATLTGTAEAGGVVVIDSGSKLLGTANVAADGTWSFTPTGLVDGPYALTVSQTDMAGNVGTATAAFTLDTASPVLTTALLDDTSLGQGITQDPALVINTTAPGVITVDIDGQQVISAASTHALQVFPTGLSNGVHQVVATETDTAGNVGSTTFQFTLDTTKPVVTAGLVADTGVSGTDGITNDPALTGTAEANGTVTVFDGTTSLGSVTTDQNGSWSFTPTGLKDGSYTLTVVQTDPAGNTGSATATFALQTQPPVLTAGLAATPVHAAGVTNTGTLTGTAAPQGIVVVYNGTTPIGQTTADADGSWTFTPTGLKDGQYTLQAMETNAAGDSTTVSIPFTLDTQAPVLTAGLADDTGASSTDGITSNDTLAGQATANSTVTVYDGTTVLGSTQVGANGAWTFAPATLADGAHTVQVTDTNAAGSQTSTTVAFTKATTTPIVTAMLLPGPDGLPNQDGSLVGTGQAGSTITIENGSTVVGSTTVGTDGRWSYNAIGLSSGDYTLTARDTDLAGNTGTYTFGATVDRVYTANNNNIDNTSTIFSVLDKPGRTANIDLTNNANAVTVFGGGANLNLTAANAAVIVNAAGQTGSTNIHSLGKDVVWAGQSNITVDGASGNQIILYPTTPTSGTVNLNTTAGPGDQVDIYGTKGTTQTVNNASMGQTTVFGGQANLVYKGSNAVIVLNGSDQEGTALVNSTGGNTVWAGSADLSMNEASQGNDTVLLTGASATTIHGAAPGSQGTTTVSDLNGTGQFEYDGGNKAANITLGAEKATVFGGNAAQSIQLNGPGTLVVADGTEGTGMQTIVIGSTGSLQFWGGSNAANITLGAKESFVQAGVGNTTLTAGSGQALVDVSKAINTVLNLDGDTSGSVVVTGYKGTGVSIHATGIDSQTIVGGSLVTHLHDGSTVTLQGYAQTNASLFGG